MLKVKNLEKIFLVKKTIFTRKASFIYAVDNISFSIDKGKIFGLVGESGCGKTTTGKLIARLIDPTSGEIYLDDTDVLRLSGKKNKLFRKNMQMIFQDPYESLNPRLTVLDTVMEPIIIQHIGDGWTEKLNRASQVLELVDLKPPQEFFYRFPHELSGGQRQRVAIARALIIEPQFIVCDEPVSMLDVSIRCSIMNLLLDLKERFNLTLLFITHDLAVARYMCDRIAVMYLGKIVEVGDTERIISNPMHPYTNALISAVPHPNPNVEKKEQKIIGQLEPMTTKRDVCLFLPRCMYKTKECEEHKPELKEVEKDYFVACNLHSEFL